MKLSNKEDDVALCKFINYSKYIYEKKKREKNSHKSRQVIKEIRMNDGIAENDIRIKANNVDRLLKEGDKVKVSIIYKGRLMSFITRGISKLTEFEKLISISHTVDRQPTIEGNRVYMVVSPNKK